MLAPFFRWKVGGGGDGGVGDELEVDQEQSAMPTNDPRQGDSPVDPLLAR